MGFEIPIIILASSFSAYTDWKTGEIPDWITYPTILLGLILSFINLKFIGIIFATALFFFWKTFLEHRVGGGDVKLLMGITILLPFYHNQAFIFNVLMFACLLGILISGPLKILDKNFQNSYRFGTLILAGVMFSLAGWSVILNA